MLSTDLIIIGSGPGGYRAAEYAAKNGLQVVIFEGDKAGGTCLNCGCIPTKTLLHESQTAATFTAAIERKEAVISQLRTGVEQLLASPGITFVNGWAAFKDSKTVICNGDEYTASNIIIATGSKTKLPSIDGLAALMKSPGSALPRVVTSTELLALDHIPNRLVIIGAGVIGMESASIFNAFGSEVTVIEFMKECLPSTDSDIAKRLRKSLEKSGITFHMQAGVKSIDASGVTFERKGKETTVAADVVLIATGRSPRIDNLNLAHAGISFNKQGITVDPLTLQAATNCADDSPHVYAIGDVNGLTLLAHAATMQGIHVVNEILGIQDHIRLDIMPAAVFTTPEVAGVGMTEDQCKAVGIPFTCKKGLYRANGKALSMNETEGILKLLANDEGRIIGCHVLGSHAADIVQEVAALMNFNATVSQLRDMIHIHPTLGEILQNTAELFPTI